MLSKISLIWQKRKHTLQRLVKLIYGKLRPKLIIASCLAKSNLDGRNRSLWTIKYSHGHYDAVKYGVRELLRVFAAYLNCVL